MPTEPQSLARAAQVVSIIDSYGYSSMIRQVFSHQVFRPSIGLVTDETEVAKGIERSRPVLDALNTLIIEGHVLDGRTLTLADCHLAPMIAYFAQAPEGAKTMSTYTALADWWETISQLPSLQETDPGLPRC